MEVLKLNASYMPLEIITFKEAFNAPCVIRLLHFIAPNKDMRFYKPFTRKNVYERDIGTCCYCGTHVSLSKFTYDHVVPRAQGGYTNWLNIVTCCLKCNSRKANRTPVEANMKLIRRPFAPLIADNFNRGMINRLKNIPKIMNNQKWRDYIYWDLPLQEEKPL